MSSGGSRIEVRVPDIGDFSGVEIIELLVAAGDSVGEDQGLVTLETDKAAMDVPAPSPGTVVELKVAAGDKVSEGDVVAVMEVAAEVADAAPAPAPADADAEDEDPRVASSESPAEPSSAATSDPRPATAGFATAHASPSVRKLARELGVDLGRVDGSGVKGRITADDIKAWVKRILSGGAAAAAGGGGLPQVPAVDFAKFGPVRVEALGRIQRISGPRLQASWVNAPHVTQHDQADVTDLEVLRAALKTDAAKRDVRLTPLAFIVKAVVQALAAFPKFNSSLSASGEELVYKEYCHIGFAADTPNGLVVPVIRDADGMSLFEIAEALGTLSAKARDGKLGPADMQGGCFTISSLGSIGGTAFTPIVNAPEVAILGVSRSSVQPVWDGSVFQPRTVLPLSLSYDHRVIDGADAARFARHIAETLEACRELVL